MGSILMPSRLVAAGSVSPPGPRTAGAACCQHGPHGSEPEVAHTQGGQPPLLSSAEPYSSVSALNGSFSESQTLCCYTTADGPADSHC